MASGATVRSVPADGNNNGKTSADADWMPTTPQSFTITTVRKDDDPGYFVRKFALDDSVNGNKWAVTADSIKECMGTFVGCPVVLVPGDMGHPAPQIQEAYRVGEIVGTRTVDGGHAAEDTIRLDEHVASLVYSGAIRYTSVQLSFWEENTEVVNAGTQFEYLLIHKWIGRHDALVADPAYGKDKAVINHICKGTESECKRRLPAMRKASGALEQDGSSIVPFVERVLSASYMPCTLNGIVEAAAPESTIAKMHDRYPGLTPSQLVASVIGPSISDSMAAAALEQISRRMKTVGQEAGTVQPTP